ncbi:TonB-dependent receptor [Thauera sp. Sel9]|uniref:TonB-dependent receptor n=1 Tax=Thauera sp. Sel9 TaxID=2974299 RepID=UPI0021E1620A|nr:TonB-dependent receptor [Thauera sp. Sel9]MCV2218538.1 TonB-dependent receptor [Thauera sp. Sel9]
MLLTLSGASSATVLAQSAAGSHGYDLPAAPLAATLNRISREAGLALTVDTGLVGNRQAAPVRGQLSPEQALRAALQGSGLELVKIATDTYTLRPVLSELSGEDRASTSATELKGVLVTGERTKDEVGHDNVYEKDISNLYVDRQYMERYQGVSVGDVFAGMNGVYNADNRHGSALFPNIRGLSGNGRVPVTVDGTQQSLDVWMALRGVNNRNYVDPNLFHSVEVEKGPSMTRGIKSGIGGSVNIRTIEAGDIIAPGQSWGLEFKASTASNSVKDGYNPFAIEGKDYRDIPGAFTASPWGAGSGVAFLKPQMNMHKRSDVSHFNGDDRKVFISGAYKHDVFDAMLAYSDARRGNYFAGTKGADRYDAEVRRGASGSSLYPYMAKIYAPGYEVPYTSTAAESILAKNNWYLPHDQKISLSYTHNRLEFGEMPAFASEVYNTVVEADPSLQLARTQFQYPFPNSRVDQKTYRIGYEMKPEDSPWLDLEMSLWRTENKSTRYQNGDVTYQVGGRDMGWDQWTQCKYHPNAANDELCQLLTMFGMFDPDNPPDKLPNTDGQYNVFIGNRMDTHAVRTGLDLSNRFRLSNSLALTVAADWQYARNRDRMAMENDGVMGMGQSNVAFGPASGRREEYGAGMNLDWKASSRLQLSAGVRYGSFWGHDDETDRRRDEQHPLWARNGINTHQNVAYRQAWSNEEVAMQKAVYDATWNSINNPGDQAAQELSSRLFREWEEYKAANNYQYSQWDYDLNHEYWKMQVPIELHDGKADRNQNPYYNGTVDLAETIDVQGRTLPKYQLDDSPGGYTSVRPAAPWQHTERQRSHAWSAQLAASYLLTDRARVYGRLSNMARFPSIMEFSNRAGSVGEFPYALKPERNHAWEVGMAYDLGGLLDSVPVADVKLSYYHNTISDFYDRTSNMNTIQFDRKIMSGLEFQSRFDTGRFYGGLGATLRLRQDMCDADYAVQLDPVHNRWSKCMPGGFIGTMSYFSLQPKYSVNLDLGTRLLEHKLDLGMRMRYHSSANNKKIERIAAAERNTPAWDGTGPRPPVSLLGGAAPTYFWRPVMLLDAYAEYNFSRQLSARLSVENLTDRYYLDPMAKVPMPGPGRTVRLDLALRY